jgi:hypothetical protein
MAEKVAPNSSMFFNIANNNDLVIVEDEWRITGVYLNGKLRLSYHNGVITIQDILNLLNIKNHEVYIPSSSAIELPATTEDLKKLTDNNLA